MYLSVIIPVYNTEQGLRACLDSVLASGYRDFEIGRASCRERV